MKDSAPEYPQFLASLKATIRQRQYQALRAVNHELLALYLEIGEAIYRKQEELGWGKAVVETLALLPKLDSPKSADSSSKNALRTNQSPKMILLSMILPRQRDERPASRAAFRSQLSSFSLQVPIPQVSGFRFASFAPAGTCSGFRSTLPAFRVRHQQTVPSFSRKTGKINFRYKKLFISL